MNHVGSSERRECLPHTEACSSSSGAVAVPLANSAWHLKSAWDQFRGLGIYADSVLVVLLV
jgi:hypothetical protein